MAKRVDANQAEIIAAIRQLGASVQDLHEVGHGCPDILVGYRWRTYPMEIKMPNGRYTADEIKWRENWKGNYYVVHNVDEAINIITNGDTDEAMDY